MDVSTEGVGTSPVADALAGLRANEARYFMNKFQQSFTVTPAAETPDTLDYVNRILAEARDLVIADKPLQTSHFEVDGVRWTYVFYESGLVVNVLYALAEGGKRAVGFKLSEGMDAPEELGAFKWARQRSKLAGEMRGSYFVVKGEY